MDGFESNLAVIVLGATNRPEILDAALLRPGRFDRRVAVPAPDKEGRAKILAVHTRSLPLADDVSLDRLAATTPGMVGADLANLANEAALMAARRNHEKVEKADFTDALEKIVLGAPRGTVLSEEDRRRVAYHEAGHALVGMLTPGADPVRKVSIIPRGQALGVTFAAPDDDRANYEESWLLAKIKVALGGRVAEEIVYGTITTGAESDIQQLTQIARGMVGRWGMSEAIGPIAVLPQEQDGAAAARLPARVGDHAAARRRGGPADRRGGLRRGPAAAHRAPRAARVAHRGAAAARDAGRGRGLRGRSSAARTRRYGGEDRNFRALARLNAARYTAEPPRP